MKSFFATAGNTAICFETRFKNVRGQSTVYYK